jgi:hypothetical protein
MCHNHGAYRLVTESHLGLDVVIHDVFHQRDDILRMLEHILGLDELVNLSEVAHDLLHLHSEAGFNVLTQ